MIRFRILVTAALPYANGPAHIGHAIGAYIPADVYTRYHRMVGNDVIYICGTDEHGTPISVTAEREGVNPKRVVDKYHGIIADSFERLGISFDNFSGTARPIHYKHAQEFFTTILEKGLIYPKEVSRPFCPSCKRFLPDRYVKGICPKCMAEDQRGDQCEECGKQLEPDELKKPYCALCHTPPEMKKTKHWYFKLSKFSAKLNRWIQSNRHWPDNSRNFCLSWIREGLEDRAITRDLKWGIPVPLKEAAGKVLYVWFDAPIGYISSTEEWGKRCKRDWKKYWTDASIVHFIGKDNIPFHGIIWPAMLMAQGGYKLPWQIASNEYLNLEGKKMSTSRGWVVWLGDALDAVDPDMLRYYLLSINPAKHDADFSWKELQTRVNNELNDVLGNFVHRTLTFTQRFFDGTVPARGELDKRDKEVLARIEKAPLAIGNLIAGFEFQKALKELMLLAQLGNQYFNEKAPWKLVKEDMDMAGTCLNICLNLNRCIGILGAPMLPFTAETIWKSLGEKGSVHEQDWKGAGEPTLSGKIGVPRPIFRKIEDEEVQAQLDRLGYAEESKEAKYVTFEDFEKLDLRVGKVLKAEKIKGSDKLLKLEVDIGERRTLVGGIGDSYTPAKIKGKEIIVLANLEPKKIRGIESQGMLLAVESGKGYTVLTPDKESKPGSKVC